jgi:hypothetical protein
MALSFVLTLFGAPTALAQTTTTSPYPGTPTTVEPAPSNADVDLGPLEPGQILNASFCNWRAGAGVSHTVLGRPLRGLTADSRGCVAIRIIIERRLVSALGSVVHPLAATGLAATADKVQVTFNDETMTVGPYGTVVTAQLVGTGNNGVNRTVNYRFTVVKPGTVTRSGVVRTGAMIARWSIGGAGLLGIGYLLILATRRRREATT